MTRPQHPMARGKESTPETQSDFLGLPGLRTVLPIEKNDFSIWVTAEQYPKLTACPECGCSDERIFIRNGKRPQLVSTSHAGLNLFTSTY